MQHSENSQLNSSINVTPLVDVVLVLLIIFMVIAPQLNLDSQIKLPETQQPPDKPENTRQIVVSITADGTLHVDDTPIEREQLPDRITSAAATIQDPQIVIKGDANLTFGHVQKTMFEIEAAGFKKVGLITRKGEG